MLACINGIEVAVRHKVYTKELRAKIRDIERLSQTGHVAWIKAADLVRDRYCIFFAGTAPCTAGGPASSLKATTTYATIKMLAETMAAIAAYVALPGSKSMTVV